MKKSILTIVLMFAALFCAAQGSSITVTSVNQRTDGSGLVDIFFNLTGPIGTYNISAQVSFNGGSTYTLIAPEFLSGDISYITPGSNKKIVWDGLGSFPNTYSINTKLKIIATVENSDGIPCPDMPTFTDPRDGQTYNTVRIGNQCWMKENLKYLPSVVGPGTGSYITPYYYVYDYYGTNVNDAKATTYYNAYGVLYNWHAALTACPTGWHLPSDNEWDQLLDYLELQGFPNDWGNPNGAGNALKSCRQVNSPLGEDCAISEHPRWNSHNTHHGFDEFGFSALPGGMRISWAAFGLIGETGFWWSSTGYSSTDAWYYGTDYGYGTMTGYTQEKTSGYSVRCLKD